MEKEIHRVQDTSSGYVSGEHKQIQSADSQKLGMGRGKECAGCDWSLTLEFPRSGITQTVLIQDWALKNGCRQWDGDGWTGLTLALAKVGKRESNNEAWRHGIFPLSIYKFKQVSVTSADNRKLLCSEETSCSCQLAHFDVALEWPWWPFSLRSGMKFLWKLGT